MELVKKNILSIICGVVALVAIIFHLVVTKPGFGKLRTEAEASAAQVEAAAAVKRTTHNYPAVQDGPPKPIPEDVFPNPDTTAAHANTLKQLEGAATALLREVSLINTKVPDGPRPLLVRGSLPTPVPPADNLFRSEYFRVTRFADNPDDTRPESDPTGTQAHLRNLPHAVLQAAVPPTGREVEEARQAVWYDPNGPYVKRLQRIVGTDQASNYAQVAAAFSRDTANFTETYLRNRAMSAKIYLGTPPVEPPPPTQGLTPAQAQAEMKLAFAEARAVSAATALSVNRTINPTAGRVPTASEIWYAQVALWVQRDICEAIAKINKNSNSVPRSAVKHLFRIGLPQGPGMFKMPGGAQPGGLGTPLAPAAPADPGDGSVPPAPVPTAGETRDYVVSATGRVGNSMYDVVHFSLEVAVDAEYVETFIRTLQENRLTCVLRADAQPIDLGEAIDLGCYYGDRPVMYVRMECETLLLRDWTVGKWVDGKQKPGMEGPPPKEFMAGVMPEAVQKELGILPPPSPNAPPPSDVPPTDTPS